MNQSIVPQSDPFKVFDFDNNSLRIIDHDGDPLFVASDVCKVLGITNVGNALARLDDDEKDSVRLPDVTGREQDIAVVNESGLYTLIIRSDKPLAKEFRRWITHEVLPAIRKTGSYLAKPMSQLEIALVQLQTMVEHERQLADHDQRIEVLEAEIDHQTDYYTVIGYCRLKHYSPITHEQAIELGRRCASLSRKRGVAIGKTSDQKYGQVGTYHIDILRAVFEGQS